MKHSLLSQHPSTLLAYAQNSVASHFLDAALTATSVPLKYRRKVITSFLGLLSQLAQDRLGSRVADTIWAGADGYMKVSLLSSLLTQNCIITAYYQEKIARTLIPEATSLGNSEYGRYFIRKLDLWGLERRPEEWREAQLGVKARSQRNNMSSRGVEGIEGTGHQGHIQRKGKADEMDELFAVVEKKQKKA